MGKNSFSHFALLITALFLTSACSDQFQSIKSFSLATSYNSLLQEAQDGGDFGATDDSRDSGDSGGSGESGDGGMDELKESELETSVNVVHRCEVGEFEFLQMRMRCNPNLNLIVTVRDIEGEQVIKSYGNLEQIKKQIGDFHDLADEMEDLKESISFLGESADVFVCLDSDLDGQCSDEAIVDFNQYNNQVMALLLNKKLTGKPKPISSEEAACSPSTFAKLQKGLVIYHKSVTAIAEGRVATASARLKNRVGASVASLAKNLDAAPEVRIAGERNTVKLQITLAKSDDKSCEVPRPRTMGCFAEGTKIHLTDELSAPIESLRAGHQVLLRNGSLSKISKVVKGPEKKKVVVVKLENNSEITITKTHPMLTEGGVVPASQLTVNSKLLQKNGQWVSIKSIQSNEYKGLVYNIYLEGELEQDHLVYANGVVSGDLYLQQKLSQPKVQLKNLAELKN